MIDKEQIKKYFREYYQINKERIKKQNKEYSQINKERIKKYLKRPKVIKRKKGYHQKYYQEHKKKRKEYFKEYNKTPKLKKKRRRYYIEKIQLDDAFKILLNLRSRIRTAIKIYSRSGKIKPACEYGIDYQAIIEHLKPFPRDRENYHIDHIIPLSWFDFNNSQEIKWAFAPENHQWLTARENINKSNKIIYVREVC